MRKIHFRPRVLFVFAATIWIIAGINILHIGWQSWSMDSHLTWKLIWLIVSTIFFGGFIFPKVVKKNIQSVLDDIRERLPLWRCMELKAWIIMAIMMTLGIILRYSGWVPYSFIAGFYIGLGAALVYSVWPYIKLGFKM